MRSRGVGATTVAALLCASAAVAEEQSWVDARVTSTFQLFQQALVPGLPGAVTRVETAAPLTLWAFSRFGGVSATQLSGSLSGELSAWGRVGPLDGALGDGDLNAAWVQYTGSRLQLRLGRQVVLPGSVRFVRFDGALASLSFEPVELQLYGGWVALPRWSQVRGAVLAGFAVDALENPALLEQQNRVGQFTYGARVAGRLPVGQLALAFHEQRDGSGVAYRLVSASALATPSAAWSVGGRASFDLVARALSEARLYADARTRWLPLSFDYAYQDPDVLLPRTSLLAAFGGAPWHELGAEATARPLQFLKVTGRAAAQWFEGARLGGRGSLKLTWLPGLDQRLLVVGEAGRALVIPSGFTFGRVGVRARLSQTHWLSGDAALYVYDLPIRDHRYSLTGIASVEWAPLRFPSVRGLLSTTVMTTPYSAFELQALARLVIELGTVAEGSTP